VTRSNVTTSWTRGARGAWWEAAVQWEAEVQTDKRWRHDERWRNNQPDKRRETLMPLIMRGAWYEVVVCWEGEAQADGRWRRDKRWCKNQPDKRRNRGAMRGGGAMRGRGGGMTRDDATTSWTRGTMRGGDSSWWEAVAWREVTRQPARQEA
jgi:hypothetical protein